MGTNTDTGLLDARGRSIRYLRISLTDRCNYSCTYCRPEEGWLPTPRSLLMSHEDITRFAEWMVERGVRKIRLTGGEPLLRKGVVSLVSKLRAISDLDELTMTTNGHLLGRFAKGLHQAGLDRLNISLDTLNAARFHSLTGGRLEAVIEGVLAAREAGFKRTRINAVLLNEVPLSERRELIEYCWSQGLSIAFIEMMPVGNLSYQTDEAALTREMLLSQLGNDYDLARDTNGRHGLSGPVDWYTVQSGVHAGQRLGTISPMSDHHFCETCNRARLSSTGGFRGCLGNDQEVQVLQEIRRGEKEACMKRVEEALNQKRYGHLMGEVGFVPLSVMTGIGG